MRTLVLQIPGLAPLALEGPDRAWTLGRASDNDVSIPDPSLSRRHARLELKDGDVWLEDLGSRNGTCVNGEPIEGPRCLSAGDELLLGLVALRVDTQPAGPRVEIDARGDASTQNSLILPLEGLREASRPAAPGTRRMREVVRELHSLAMELLEEAPADRLFEHLLDGLWRLFSPWRAAVLIQDAQFGLVTVASRGPQGNRPILLGRSLVEAALERKESVLFTGLGAPGEVASASLISSGVTSALATPMEHQGVVKGLLYMDCRPPHPAFDEEDLRLASTLAHLATAKLEHNRMREEALARRKVEDELNLARHVQQGLLPGFPPDLEGFELWGNNLPSRQVSGDLFGWWPRGDGRWLLSVADVSGKGLGPGLLMASLQATLDAWTYRDLPTAELAYHLSRTLARRTDGRRFVTAFLAVLDLTAGEISFTNAGHNPALLFRREGPPEALWAHGLPLAMLPGRPYGEGRLRLEPGDLLVIYTDGITETLDPGGEEFGQDALAAFLGERRAEPLMALDAKLMAELDRFSGGAQAMDDRTLLMLRRT
jgi:sigma-B regulation protein RsbU (phosphoserine phosphatase)